MKTTCRYRGSIIICTLESGGVFAPDHGLDRPVAKQRAGMGLKISSLCTSYPSGCRLAFMLQEGKNAAMLHDVDEIRRQRRTGQDGTMGEVLDHGLI
jgi:hypothetical protein